MKLTQNILPSCKTFTTKNVKKEVSDYTPQSEHTQDRSTLFLAFKKVLECILGKVIPLSSHTLLIAIFFFCNLAASYASPVEIDLKAIASIESSHNSKAVSFLGAKYGRGLYQVSEIALADYLQYHKKETITPDDLFNPAINERIAVWLLTVRIPQVLKHLKRPVTLETVLSAYNKGYSKELAFNYIKKYRRAVK